MAVPQRRDNPEFKFDFDAAVVAARRDYPEETKNVTFIDLAKPEGHTSLWEWHGTTSPYFQWENDLLTLWTDRAICMIDEETNKKLLLFNSTIDTSIFPDLLSRQEALNFTFNHELGHMVADNGLTAVNKSRQRTKPEAGRDPATLAEMAADCFGILRSLSQRTLTIEEARHIASLRRGSAAGKTHATARAIDAIIKTVEDKKLDALKMTLGEMKDAAMFYAEKYSVSLHDDGAPGKKNQDWLENMVDVCEKSDNSFAPHLKRRAAQTGGRHLLFKQA